MKKVLIIVYYWPPSGGAGVQRWLKFVKYLPQFGWLPTVITTRNGDYPAIDFSLENDVPKNISVIRTKTPSFGKIFAKAGKESIPYGSLAINQHDSFLRKLAIWIRLNLIIPDARRIWNKYALKAATLELKKNKYDWIITSGPPHSTHLIGLKLKKKFKLKWLADFRDPWTEIDYLEKVKRLPFTELLDKKLEKKVVEECNILLSINKKIIENLGLTQKGKVIPNGYDPDDFDKVETVSNETFTISYFGNITSERNPENMVKALYQHPEIVSQCRLDFWGNVDLKIIATLKSLDQKNIVNFHPYIPHQEVLQKMVNSDLLLLVINNVPNNKGILTGKIFEYLGSGVPILAVGPVDGDAAGIIKETASGKMFAYNDVSGMAEFILKVFHSRGRDKRKERVNEIHNYSRKVQTHQLVDILENN